MNSPYMVERVPSKYMRGMQDRELWYCHRKGHGECPVFGSIGTKKHAESVCKAYNPDGVVHYTEK